MASGKLTDILVLDHHLSSDLLHYAAVKHNRTRLPSILNFLIDFWNSVFGQYFGCWISLIWAGSVHEHGTNTAEVRGSNTRSIYTSHVYIYMHMWDMCTYWRYGKCHSDADQTLSNMFPPNREVWIQWHVFVCEYVWKCVWPRISW